MTDATRPMAVLLMATALAACTPARLLFGAAPGATDTEADAPAAELAKARTGSLPFFNPEPHLLVTVGTDCAVASQVVALPGRRRQVVLKPGYGSSELSLGFNNGLITSVGQKSDTKVPETITAISGLATGIAKVAAAGVSATSTTAATNPPPARKTCPPQAHLYPIGDSATVDTAHDKLQDLKIEVNR